MGDVDITGSVSTNYIRQKILIPSLEMISTDTKNLARVGNGGSHFQNKTCTPLSSSALNTQQWSVARQQYEWKVAGVREVEGGSAVA